MKVLCTALIVLLGVASPLSLWADAIFPCNQQDKPASWDSVIGMSAHTDAAAYNGRDSTHGKNSHHGGNKNSDSFAIDCVCCGGCASSAGTTNAIGSDSLDSLLANRSQLNPVAKTIHGNSDRISLFRPPKPNA